MDIAYPMLWNGCTQEERGCLHHHSRVSVDTHLLDHDCGSARDVPLAEHRVTVAMESTGVYWKPVYNVLEDDFGVMVVNARHIKNVPGRKTDVKDAEWIASLLRHGLLRGSFIPDRPQRELRELTRYRRSIVEERARVVNRIQKVLEGGVKLSSVATDVLGVSGRAMLDAMVGGVNDWRLAKGRLRNKQHALEQALSSLMADHQRMMLPVESS